MSKCQFIQCERCLFVTFVRIAEVAAEVAVAIIQHIL